MFFYFHSRNRCSLSISRSTDDDRLVQRDLCPFRFNLGFFGTNEKKNVFAYGNPIAVGKSMGEDFQAIDKCTIGTLKIS